MLICDICKKPDNKCSKISLHYGYGSKAFQAKTYDVCEDCANILKRRKTIVEIAFIYNATEEEVIKDLELDFPLHEEGDLYT